MTILTPAAKEKEVNYTPEMVQVLKDNAPLNYEKAKVLAVTLNRNYRSIIAKAKREKIEYIAKEPAIKKGRDVPTKAQMVKTIEAALDSKLLGLEKAPVLALTNIIAAIAEFAKADDTEESETVVSES
jgi:plasmid replication initiation protein